ncbi:Exo_endo_phos domain-containing protein [Gossypium australe]|uniref:Exo_endo_phos domain-containing protein n=1 Tax=Gossypium australe TaxID=47621 RepID=A0A5B6U2Q5_9ROSI|nr:Exo_endo_phos domain-containing protein [Gossypium australe]
MNGDNKKTMWIYERDRNDGGLSLGWRDGLNLTLKSFSKSHIDMEVEEENELETWKFTGFYGVPVEYDKREL